MAANDSFTVRSPCTPRELIAIVKEAKEGLPGCVLFPSRSYDEVYPNIYISDKSFALSKSQLKEVGITHVVNTAQGISFGHVNTDHDYYKDTDISFFAIKASDVSKFNISPFLTSTSYFIDGALQTEGDNKVLVHCVQGFSRSPTVVVAYLMIKRNMDVRDALRTVRAKREVCPNDGFMEQLCKLNDGLLEEIKS